MQGRGVEVDHSSLNRWVIKYTPALDHAFRQSQLDMTLWLDKISPGASLGAVPGDGASARLSFWRQNLPCLTLNR